MGTNDWTDSEKIVLKKMWLDGRSSRECAAALPGRTHSACIGQARRLGLPIRDISKDNVGRKRRSIAQKDKVPPAAGAASKPRAPPSSEPHAFVDIAHEPHGGTEVSLLDARPRQCRWPLGDPRSADFKFCGRGTVMGMSWCEHHARKGYQLPAVKRREFGVKKAPAETKTVLETAE